MELRSCRHSTTKSTIEAIVVAHSLCVFVIIVVGARCDG